MLQLYTALQSYFYDGTYCNMFSFLCLFFQTHARIAPLQISCSHLHRFIAIHDRPRSHRILLTTVAHVFPPTLTVRLADSPPTQQATRGFHSDPTGDALGDRFHRYFAPFSLRALHVKLFSIVNFWPVHFSSIIRMISQRLQPIANVPNHRRFSKAETVWP